MNPMPVTTPITAIGAATADKCCADEYLPFPSHVFGVELILVGNVYLAENFYPISDYYFSYVPIKKKVVGSSRTSSTRTHGLSMGRQRRTFLNDGHKARLFVRF